MVIITFQDRATQTKALGFLMGRFSGSVLKNGEHYDPKAALAALAAENISFTVKGRATYKQQAAAVRGAVSAAIKRRKRSVKKCLAEVVLINFLWTFGVLT